MQHFLEANDGVFHPPLLVAYPAKLVDRLDIVRLQRQGLLQHLRGTDGIHHQQIVLRRNDKISSDRLAKPGRLRVGVERCSGLAQPKADVSQFAQALGRCGVGVDVQPYRRFSFVELAELRQGAGTIEQCVGLTGGLLLERGEGRGRVRPTLLVQQGNRRVP